MNLGLARRFQTIRAELVDIDAKTSPIVTSDEACEREKCLALGVCRLCRILVRVIDALP
jgi:hypothetical protein